MRGAVLTALLLAGCTGTPAAPSADTPAPATAAAATPTASTPSPSPTASPTASPVANTVYTADDEALATLMRAAADEAIPQLNLLNEMDPSKLEDLFLPLDVWITSQRTGLEAYTPSSCTTAAVALFSKALDGYDAIRKRFMAWRDWGAHGRPFAFAAPRGIVRTFEEALVELEAHCPA
jgi:hypothetical protein